MLVWTQASKTRKKKLSFCVYQTHLDGINAVTPNTPHFGTPSNEGQIVTIQKSNKPHNPIGLDERFETAAAVAFVGPTTHAIAIVNHVQHVPNFFLRIHVWILRTKVCEGSERRLGSVAVVGIGFRVVGFYFVELCLSCRG